MKNQRSFHEIKAQKHINYPKRNPNLWKHKIIHHACKGVSLKPSKHDQMRQIDGKWDEFSKLR